MSGPSSEQVVVGNGAAPGREGRFTLLGPPVLSRSAVLRDEGLRFDTARQRAGWPTARQVVVDADGRVPVEWTGAAPEGPWGMDTDGTARLVTAPTTGDTPSADAVLLGEADGTAYWAVRAAKEGSAGAGAARDGDGPAPGEDPVTLADLRQAGAALDALGAGLLTTAVAVLSWHDAAGFCGRDGSRTIGGSSWYSTHSPSMRKRTSTLVPLPLGSMCTSDAPRK